MTKILTIIAPKDFQDTEYLVPKEIFEKTGFEMVTASAKKDCLGVFGLNVTADLLINEIKVEDYEAVVLVGGGGAQIFINNPQIHQLLKNFYHAGKIVGAICLSPAILAQAGLLKNKKVTVFPHPQLIKIVKQGGGEYTGKLMEQDGSIITATDPTAAENFARAIAKTILY